MTAGVFAHFDPDGEVAPHVRRAIESLCGVADPVIVVSTAPLLEESAQWIEARARLVRRRNVGHDFESYRIGIGALGPAVQRLILMNDSAVMPLVDLATLVDTMNPRADYWGVSPGFGFAPHLQSYFLAFDGVVTRSEVWTSFWRDLRTPSSRDEAVMNGEIRLADSLRSAGFSAASVLSPGRWDMLVGAARASGGELGSALRERRIRGIAGWVRRLRGRAQHPEWNPSAALADISLRRADRLPAVKLSVLRDDPYHLGAERLLTGLEARFPPEFDGVREYLARTGESYADRRDDSSTEPAVGPFHFHTRISKA